MSATSTSAAARRWKRRPRAARAGTNGRPSAAKTPSSSGASGSGSSAATYSGEPVARTSSVPKRVGLGDDELDRDALDRHAERPPVAALDARRRSAAAPRTAPAPASVARNDDGEPLRRVAPAARVARGDRRRAPRRSTRRARGCGAAATDAGPPAAAPRASAARSLRSVSGPMPGTSCSRPAVGRLAELRERAHAERAADLEHPLARDAEEPPEPDELRRDLALELVQLGDLAGLDELAQPPLDPRPDPAQLAGAALRGRAPRPARASRGSGRPRGGRRAPCTARRPPARAARRTPRAARRSRRCPAVTRARWIVSPRHADRCCSLPRRDGKAAARARSGGRSHGSRAGDARRTCWRPRSRSARSSWPTSRAARDRRSKARCDARDRAGAGRQRRPARARGARDLLTLLGAMPEGGIALVEAADGTTNALALAAPSPVRAALRRGQRRAFPRAGRAARRRRRGRGDPEPGRRRGHARRPRAARRPPRRPHRGGARRRCAPALHGEGRRPRGRGRRRPGSCARWPRSIDPARADDRRQRRRRRRDPRPARLARPRHDPLHAHRAARRDEGLGPRGRDLERARDRRPSSAARAGSGSATSTSASISFAPRRCGAASRCRP